MGTAVSYGRIVTGGGMMRVRDCPLPTPDSQASPRPRQPLQTRLRLMV
jgi:hypothetical protein